VLGDSDALVVASCLDKFRDDFQAHIDLGRCPFEESPLAGVLAPAVQHERRFHRELDVIPA
jgi:hypothetical protein